MNTRIGAYSLSWLLDPAADTALVPSRLQDVERLPYNLPADVGAAWVEKLALNDGMALFRAVHDLGPSLPGQLVPLMEVHTEPDEPNFNAQIWLSGIGCHHEYWQEDALTPVEIVASPGRDTFRHHQRWRAKILVEGGVTSEMRSVIVAHSTLNALLGAEMAAMMLARLGLSAQRQTVVRAIPPHVNVPLREAMAGPFMGPARKLHAQARVLDYLAGLLHQVTQDNEAPKERRHQKRIQDLHDYLLNLEGRLPTLNELASDFALSARRLNAEFVAEYGQSIYSFVTDRRLEAAHASLLESSIPMKSIAARLGYSHVNHFIAAFKRKFGYPPGSLRRR